MRSPPPASLRRPLVIRVIAVAIVVVLGITAFALSRLRLPANPSAAPADLAAPLPAAAEADLAETMPAIDEIRQHRGSLLDGTLLESIAAPELPHDNSYIDLLRREARRMDGLAADSEDIGNYDSADCLRRDAAHLRLQARELSASFSNQYGSQTVNR